MRLIAVGVLAALLGVVPLAAAAADPYREVPLALAEGLLALFPPVEGYVVSAAAGEAYIDVALRDLVAPGMELQIYRPGAEMIQPVTRQVLGFFEKNLGTLSLTEVRASYSRGRLDAAAAAAGVASGDRVRLSARRLRALLHVAGAAAGIEIGPLAQALIARGEQSGRFAMIDEPGWATSLAVIGAPWETVRADPAQLRLLGETAAADLLLLAKVEPGAVSRVAIEVRSLRSGTMLGELSERWPASAAVDAPVSAPAPVAPGPVAAAPAPAADEYIVRELTTVATSLAAGNILGEGRPDVVLTDGVRLSLFRWEADALSWRWDEDGRGGRRILALDAADFDGDGRAEVIVTTLARGRVTSELRRWQDGALRIAATVDGVYLRAAQAGDPALLLGQRAGIDDVLVGRVEQYRLRAGSFERVAGSALPAGVGIFGLALAAAGAPVLLYASDRDGAIAGVSATGAIVWRSRRPYGGCPPPLTTSEIFGPGAAVGEEGSNAVARAFPSRLLAEQFPGGWRLVVTRTIGNTSARRAPGERGEVVILAGPPEFPEELRRSLAFDGCVADLARADIDGDGSAEILFVVNRFAGVLQKDRGRLVAWRPVGVRDEGKKSP